MLKRKMIFFVFTLILFSVAFFNVDFSYAGWEVDPTGDASKTYFDITNVTISKNYLSMKLAENPYYNNSDVTWRFYNIWIDTSLEDSTPDTETWSTDVYEYVAHFDCRWNGSHWLNNSYINAFRYYLTSDGSSKVTGAFYWDGSSWIGSNPNIDIATVSGTTISFDTEGALYRESYLGTGAVVQGIANTSNLTVVDVAPNNAWIDEFDNMCVPPNPEPTSTPLSIFGLLLGLTFLGFIGAGIRQTKK